MDNTNCLLHWQFTALHCINKQTKAEPGGVWATAIAFSPPTYAERKWAILPVFHAGYTDRKFNCIVVGGTHLYKEDGTALCVHKDVIWDLGCPWSGCYGSGFVDRDAMTLVLHRKPSNPTPNVSYVVGFVLI